MANEFIAHSSQLEVPNRPPLDVQTWNRIAIVFDSPSVHDEQQRYPLQGPSGSFFERLLFDCGIDPRLCYLGYLSPSRVHSRAFSWESPTVQRGIAQLHSDFATLRPNLILFIGAGGLHFLNAGSKNLDKWRGSLFTAQSLHGIKCLATYDPGEALKFFAEQYPLLKFDCQRAAAESKYPQLILPQRELLTSLPSEQLINIMDTWPAGVRCSLDIEGGLPTAKVHPKEIERNKKRPEDERRSYGWPCVSICASPTRSITIAWSKFTPSEHALVLRSFARLMARTDVPKVLQNSLYDNFVLSYGYRIPIRSVVEDTMLKGWEVYCELKKGLGPQASIWTLEPYWKAERTEGNSETYYRYCAKDSAVTLEICNAQDSALDAAGRAHYAANVEMLNPIHYMEHRGILLDTASVAVRRSEVESELHPLNEQLDSMAGSSLRGPKGALVPQRLCKVLYEEKGYPPQYVKENGRNTTKVTSDVMALLSLGKTFPDDPFIAAILRQRHLLGLLKTLNILPDPDGRVRCGYNVVGTETGRLTCYTSPTGSGANMTTITKKLRLNYRADPAHDFGQFDLKGADGWTVAAHCAAIGDGTMLEDYHAGLKPAQIIAMMYLFGADINRLSRRDLAFWSTDERFALISKLAGKWVYMGSKRVQHGTNYLMGIPTMQNQVMQDSYKYAGAPIYLAHHDAKALQGYYLTRYWGVPLWHEKSKSLLATKGTLTSASGHTRMFFGRRFGTGLHGTLQEYLADEPQQNTTWSTNLAMLALWKDPANRVAKREGRIVTTCDSRSHYLDVADPYRRLIPGSLLIEPLHQVHDALCVQWPQCFRSWAIQKMKSYFSNPLTIAGRTLTIPVDGSFGPSWGEQPTIIT